MKNGFRNKNFFDIVTDLRKGKEQEIPAENYRDFKTACTITGTDLSGFCQSYPVNDNGERIVVIIPENNE